MTVIQLDCQGRPTPDEAYLRASEYQATGRLREAEFLLLKILAVLPRHASALHLLGVVAGQSGQRDRALRLFSEAVAIEPDVALFHFTLAQICRQRGRLAEAIEHGGRAVALDATSAPAHTELGIAYFETGNYDQAEACQLRALSIAAGMAPALNNLGSIQRARSDRLGAMAWFRKALEAAPDFVPALANLGSLLLEEKRVDEAETYLEKSCAFQPDYPEALAGLAFVRIQQGRAEDAVPLFQQALRLKPGYSEASKGLAETFYQLGRLEEAAPVIQGCVIASPDFAQAWLVLAMVCSGLGKGEEAEAAYRKALSLCPEMVAAMSGLGALLLQEGRMGEAKTILQKATALAPADLGARFTLCGAGKVKPGDENFAALEAMAADNIGGMGEESRILLNYALGKACDDLGDYERAFHYFQEGARIKRSRLSYDPKIGEARVDRIIRVVDRDFLENRRGGGDPSDVPIFILGMPRSGTTLVEQIIASHPQVHGAGELSYMLEILSRPRWAEAPVSGFDEQGEMNRDTLTTWGTEYVARLRSHAPDARRITDKMPANYLGLGVIQLMLPNAKIIHVRRDPVDTCLSCFFQLFERDYQPATYDFSELGRWYVSYARLMEHWRSVLPGGFLEVRYEDIVGDLENQARRLIAHCALEWDDACLAFHQTRRRVITASVAQVRQPLHGDSVARWRRYGKFLGPLLDALGPYAPKDRGGAR